MASNRRRHAHLALRRNLLSGQYRRPFFRNTLRIELLETRALLSVQPVEVASNSPAIPISPDVIEWATNPVTHAVNLLLAEKNWTNSEQIANDFGAHLVTINDDAENSWVWNTFNSQLNRHLWIGLSDSAQE